MARAESRGYTGVTDSQSNRIVDGCVPLACTHHRQPGSWR
jgi:hypothetical protein